MMARTTVNDKNQAGATAAPAPSPEGDDVKVDIEVEGDEKPEQTADAQQEKPETVEAEVIDPDAEDDAPADADADEQAKVEAAIKAGEAAADQDFKSEADGLRAERDELAKKLASVSEDIDAAKAELEAGTRQVFDVTTFTVDGQQVESYQADVDTDANYTPDTEVVENGAFQESKFRSAPYFDLRIDGITLLDEAYG